MLKLSRMIGLGEPASDFAIPDTHDNIRILDDSAKWLSLLVAFICKHGPFVLHVIDYLLDFAREYAP